MASNGSVLSESSVDPCKTALPANANNVPSRGSVVDGGRVSRGSVPRSPGLGRPAMPRKPGLPGPKPRPPVPKKPPVTQKPSSPVANHASTDGFIPSVSTTPLASWGRDTSDGVQAQVPSAVDASSEDKTSPTAPNSAEHPLLKGPPPPLPKVPPRGTLTAARHQLATQRQPPQRPAPPVPAKKPAIRPPEGAEGQEENLQSALEEKLTPAVPLLEEKPTPVAPPRSYHQVVVEENCKPVLNEVEGATGGVSPITKITGAGSVKSDRKDNSGRTAAYLGSENASAAKILSENGDQNQCVGDGTSAEPKENSQSSPAEKKEKVPRKRKELTPPVTFVDQNVAQSVSAAEHAIRQNHSGSGGISCPLPTPPPVRPKPRKRSNVFKQSQEGEAPEQSEGKHEKRTFSLSLPAVPCEEVSECESRKKSKSESKEVKTSIGVNSSQKQLSERFDPHEKEDVELTDKVSCSETTAEPQVYTESVNNEDNFLTVEKCNENLSSKDPEPAVLQLGSKLCEKAASAYSLEASGKNSIKGSQAGQKPAKELEDKDCTQADSETQSLSLSLQDVGETCGMLKEIEDLLKQRLGDTIVSPQHPQENDDSKDADDSTPVRPPRPRRASKLKHLNLGSSSVDSSSTESLTSVGTPGSSKKAPPKPKRKHPPVSSITRSLSDVTGMRNIVDQYNDVEDDEEKPFLPPRQQSLRLLSGPRPPPLPPRNKSMDPPKDRPGSGGSGSEQNTSVAPASEKDDVNMSQTSTPCTGKDADSGGGSSAPGSGTLGRGRGRKNIPRPMRKAPPPPPHAPGKPSATTPSPTHTPNSASSSPSQSSTGSLEKELGYRKIANGSSPAGEDINTVVPNTAMVGSMDSPSLASDESIDHDYHEIPDHLIRDLSAKLAQAAAAKAKEESPPPDLPPRGYKSQSSSQGHEHANKDSDPTCEYKSAEQDCLSSYRTAVMKSPDDSVYHSGRESLTPASFSSMTFGSSLDVAGDGRRPASSVSLHSNSSHSEAGSAEQEVPTFDQMSSASESENEDDEEKQAKKREKKVYFIAEEMMKSEQVFVDVLKLLNVDFRVFISMKTEQVGHSIVPAETLNKILDFLPQLQSFNEMLLKDLRDRIANWEKHKKIADVFVKKGPFLKLYSSYIRNFENVTALLDETCKKHHGFQQTLQQFEMSPRCASLALKHYMLKPIQRIPQYKLLLQDYLKHLTSDSPDHKDTITALNIVSEVADHANESMRHGDNVQKLLEIQRSLIGQFEVIQPGRVLIKQGELMKLSRKEMQPRMFFLFNDVLLYTTPSTGGYRLNNILPLNGMKVVPPTRDEFRYEFHIISTQRSFTVAASSAEECETWLTALYNAIDENSERYHTFKSMMQEPKTSLLDKDFVLGHKAPLWVPDARVTMCMLCLAEFSITWRRHHCRACGRIICGNCSENKAPLRYLFYKPARVCDECYEKLKKEIDEHLEEMGSRPLSDELTPMPSSTETGSLSFSSIKARFQKIRKSAREKRKSGMIRPSVLKEVHANDEGSDMSGYLWVAKNKKWKRLWFVVKGKVLYTYKASEDMAAIESMPLLGFEITRMTSWYQGAEPDLMFELKHQNTQPLVFKSRTGSSSSEKAATEESSTPSAVISPHAKSSADTTTPRLIFRTDSAAATTKWLNILREASLA